jgi:hypothetical protein
MRRSLPLAAVVASCLAWGCGEQKKLPLEPTGYVPDPTATFTRVQSEIFATSCAFSGCHAGVAPASGMDLSPGASWTAVHATSVERSDLKRIEPGSPDRSYMVRKVRGDADISGGRMPLGGPYLSAAQVKLLVDWVLRGAPQD